MNTILPLIVGGVIYTSKRSKSLRMFNWFGGYNSGYEAGKTSVWDDSHTHISECNNGNGMIGEVPPCWHEGFKDGHDSK